MERPSFALPSTPSTIVQTHEALLKFSETVSAAVEGQLLSGAKAPAELKLLLALRVHTALLLGNDSRALDSAARIRQLQATFADRHVAGLMTEAIVAARRATKDRSNGADFVAAFSASFRERLDALPKSPEITAALKLQRTRTAELDRPALLHEAGQIRSTVAGRYTLEQADQIIRIGHKLTTLLPLRDTTLKVFDDVLAASVRR